MAYSRNSTKDEIEKILFDHIYDHYSPDGLCKSDLDNANFKNLTLSDDLSLDSLDEVELCIEMEKLFDISITDDDASGWITIDNIVETILKNLQEAS